MSVVSPAQIHDVGRVEPRLARVPNQETARVRAERREKLAPPLRRPVLHVAVELRGLGVHVRRDIDALLVEAEVPPQRVVRRFQREPGYDRPELPRDPLGGIRPFEHHVERARSGPGALASAPESVFLVPHERAIDDDTVDPEQLERFREVGARQHRDLRPGQHLAHSLEERVKTERNVAEPAVPVHEAGKRAPSRAARGGAPENALELVAAQLADEAPDHRASSESIAAATGATSIACMHRGAGHSCGPRVQCFSHAISRLKSSFWSRQGKSGIVTAR